MTSSNYRQHEFAMMNRTHPWWAAANLPKAISAWRLFRLLLSTGWSESDIIVLPRPAARNHRRVIFRFRTEQKLEQFYDEACAMLSCAAATCCKRSSVR